MRIVTFIIICLLALACVNNKSNSADSPKEEGIAKFEILQDFHNFGDLKAGETVAFSFEIKNTGNTGLLIKKLETDCGCIDVEYPKEKINPDDSAYIEVIFNSAGEVGRVYKTITVFTNAEEEGSLAISATVKNELINLYSKN